jgi:hypothetical protein
VIRPEVAGGDPPRHRLSHRLFLGLSRAGNLVELLDRGRQMFDQLEAVARFIPNPV